MTPAFLRKNLYALTVWLLRNKGMTDFEKKALGSNLDALTRPKAEDLSLISALRNWLVQGDRVGLRPTYDAFMAVKNKPKFGLPDFGM